MANPNAWMPLYVADWDADTAHLDCEQDGAYGRLIRHYWRTGILPDDDAVLARIVRMDVRKWRRLRVSLADFFHISGGKWTHKRVEKERKTASDNALKAQAKAKAAADARWSKTQPQQGESAKATPQNPDATRMPQAVLVASLEHCPSPSPLPTEDKKDAIASSVVGADIAAAFEAWNATARRLGLPVAKDLTTDRRKHIRARLGDAGMDGWSEALRGVEASRHCRGGNDRAWKADLDFVCQPKSFQRLREGFYGTDAPLVSAEPDWPALVGLWAKSGRWSPSLGPPPDAPDTRVPVDLRPSMRATA